MAGGPAGCADRATRCSDELTRTLTRQIDLGRVAWTVGACLAAAVAAIVAFGNGTSGDYGNPRCANWACDDPSRSIHELTRGDVAGFFRHQPSMGLVSLVLRAPMAAIAHARGGGIHSEYEAGAALCLAVAIVLTIWAAHAARRLGAPLAAVLVGVAVWTAAILWSRALLFGHPEEPLAGAFVVAALAAAATRRPVAAGVFIGLAIATKEWALLLVPAVVFAGAASEWRRVITPALAVVVVALGTMALGNFGSFRAAHEAQNRGDKHNPTPADVWFRLHEPRVVARHGDVLTIRDRPPKLIGRWCRPFVIVVAALLSLLFARRRRTLAAALALAAMVLCMRVLLDTATFSYHVIPLLMAVAAWELLGQRRFPFFAVAATVAFQLTARIVSTHFSPDDFNTIFLAWTVPLTLVLAVATFRRQRSVPTVRRDVLR